MEALIVNSFLKKLISNGINCERLAVIMAEAKCQQVSFISHLIKGQIVESAYLSQLLAKELCLEFVDLDTIDPFRLPLHLIEKKLLRKHQVLPLWQDNKRLGLAMVDPTQQLVIDDIRFHTGLILEKILVEPEKLKVFLEKIIVKSNSKKEKSKNARINLNSNQKNKVKASFLGSNRYFASQKESSEENEVAVRQSVYQVLQLAIERGASDIHIEPYPTYLQVRFRIDGLLYAVTTFPLQLLQRIIIRLKIMSQLDIAERRIPQDGRFQIKNAENKNIDCRINTCPTLHGEKLVIRILDSDKMQLAINNLGMNETQKNNFLHALNCPHGMVLVTGPTGSGKTITLYSALKFLNTLSINISSVENPVEIILPGVNQININPKVGLSFANVLRAFLRQDPDVIMVGEMRDQETAEIGIKAAQTGHLVLSSLHTNSAAESLVRLINMGIPPYNIASSVNLIIAQRLARRLCPYCKIKEILPDNILLKLGFSYQDISSITLFSAKGCMKCTEGYRGRIGIFEILIVSEDIKFLILRGYDVTAIESHAQTNGMQTLYASALEKLKLGEISLIEMKRIIKD